MTKRIMQNILSLADFERELNAAESDSIVYLENNFEFDLEEDKFFLVGTTGVRALVSFFRKDVILDGQGNKITVRCRRTERNNTCIFYLTQEARGCEIRNLTLNFEYLGEDTTRTFIGILNNAYGAKINRCKIVMNSEKNINMTAISCRGIKDMQSETRMDNFTVEYNDIRVYCKPETVNGRLRQCGIENLHANSISISGNYVLAVVRGNGENQIALGVSNSGRYARIENNNIKTNGDHSDGLEKEHAHVCGFENEGEFLIFIGNNCVGEWAGKAVGAYNRAHHAIFQGNKFLATHTIHGVALRNEGNYCTITANLLMSTSRNARLLENTAHGVTVSSNVLRAIYFTDKCQSGYGMVVDNSEGCYISGNQIIGVKNCGIFCRNSKITSENNFIQLKSEWPWFEPIATENNGMIAAAIDEGKIHNAEKEIE